MELESVSEMQLAWMAAAAAASPRPVVLMWWRQQNVFQLMEDSDYFELQFFLVSGLQSPPAVLPRHHPTAGKPQCS